MLAVFVQQATYLGGDDVVLMVASRAEATLLVANA